MDPSDANGSGADRSAMHRTRIAVLVALALAAAGATMVAEAPLIWLGAAVCLVTAAAVFAGTAAARLDLLLLAVMVAVMHEWQYPDRATATATATVTAIAIVLALTGERRQSLAASGFALGATVVLLSGILDPKDLRWIGVTGCLVAAVAVAQPMKRARGTRVVTALAADMIAGLIGAGMIATMAIVGELSSIVLAPFAVLLLAVLGVVARWSRFSELLAAELARSKVLESEVPMVELSPDGVLLQVSPAAERLGLVIGTSLLDSIEGSSHEAVAEALAFTQAGAGSSVFPIRRLAGDEGWRDLEVDLRYLGPEADSWVASFTDRTDDLLDRQRTEVELGRLRNAVTTDRLTGVLNREGIIGALQDRLRTGAAVVLFLDLDGFKAVNDTYGHEAGDAVLVAVARRLANAVGEHWSVGRLGGDEFLLVGAETELRAEDLAQLADLVGKPVVHKDRHLQVATSMGVAVGQRGADPDALLRAADAEMYRHKQQRKGGGEQVPAPDASPVVGERRLSQLFTR